MAIYRLCEEFPDHNDVGAVQAKLELIGRFYSASPRRGIGKLKDRYKEENFFLALARYLKSSNLEYSLEKARKIERVDCQNLAIISDIHNDFSQEIVRVINEFRDESNIRQVNNRISFASKYLHFHAPMAFFIYDSVIIERLKAPAGLSYRRLCEKLLEYASSAFDPDWTPRSIDAALYPYNDVGIN